MAQLDLLHFFQADMAPIRAWELVDWCLSAGATDFTLSALVSEGSPTTGLEPFETAATPFKCASEARRHLSGPPESGLIYSTDLWHLTPHTLAALRLAFPYGPLDYRPADAWFEDLEIYRQGELLLGILTHEHEGVLRVTPAEREHLDGLGFPYRLKGEWVGY